MRVAITYAIVAWLIIQVANATFGSFGIPEWAYRFVVIMLCIFFPVAVILAWAFELTPEGIKTTKVAQEAEVTEVSKAHEKKRNWFSLLFAAAVPTLIFGALALIFFFQAKSSDSELSALSSSRSATDKSIAVLPFTNMSPDAENAYFADGIHETILTTLANLGDLRVTSRTSVMPYRDSNKSIPVIAEELNVAYILEGSVQKIGNDFRLTTQLIQAGTDEHLWAKNYDGEFKEVFAVQSQLAREISQSLKAVLSPEENQRLEKKPTANLKAYDLYLKALTFDRRSKEHIQLMEEAVALDPNFTLAWTRLSASYSTLYITSRDRTPATMMRAREATRRAFKIDPESPEVLLAIGYFNYGCLREYWIAEYFYRQVKNKLPNEARVYEFLGLVYRRDGRWRESIENFEKAHRLDPSSSLGFLRTTNAYIHDWFTSSQYQIIMSQEGALLGNIYKDFVMEGKTSAFEESDELSLQQKTELAWVFGDVSATLRLIARDDQADDSETFGQFKGRSNSWRLGVAHLVNGDVSAARPILTAYRDTLSLKSETALLDYNTLGDLGSIEALLGNEEASLNAFERASILVNEQIDSFHGVELSVDRAIALAWLGHQNEAVAELARLIKIPSNLNVHWMRRCLDFWPLRDHPGFQAILNDPANSQPLDLDKL